MPCTLRATVSYVPCGLRALVSHIPRALRDLVPRNSRVLVPHMPRALSALVSQVSRALCTLVPQVPHALIALLPHAPLALRRVFVTHLPFTLGAFVPLVPYLLQVCQSQHALMFLMHCSSRISHLLYFWYFSYLCCFPPWTTVVGYATSIKRKLLKCFFIRNISLQDPLIYVDLTTLILQPPFVRK